MATSSDKRARQERILAELSELGLALARDLQARALAAQDVAEASELGLAFHRVSRSVRQTLALEAKLERDAQRADREDLADAVRARTARADRRRAQVRIAVERCVWSEADGPEAERLLHELDDRLEEAALSDDFTGEDPVDVHIARICAELGVEPPAPTTFEAAREASRGVPAGRDAQADPPLPRRSSG
jgi:hypothetical protein